MNVPCYDVEAPKKSANLSVNSDLLRAARVLKINLSQLLEVRLAEVVRQAQAESWLTENRSTLEDYNARIERDGVFSDDLRPF